jgi:4'-phosphopantetheinyl transferase
MPADFHVLWTRVDARMPAPVGSLADGTVHVWLLNLDDPPRRVEDLRDALSPDEQLRAARFKFDRDKHRFEAGRGLLRLLLGTYAGIAPGALQFKYGAFGKPMLAHGLGQGLQFNLSHSDRWALLATATRAPIGVDIEAVRDAGDHEEIARQNFSPRERQRLLRLPEALRAAAFTACWAQKEAFVKALGAGLGTIELNRFEWAAGPGGCAVLHAADPAIPRDPWTLIHFAPEPGFRAAVAVRAGAAAFQFYRYA